MSGKTTVKPKIIWITGASSGIGRELTLQYAAAGERVFASARSRSALEQLTQTNAAHPIVSVPCDVTDRMSLQNAAKKIQDDVGYIDQVIINAGVCEYFDIREPDWNMMARVMAVNYFGAINTVEVALPLLREGEVRKPCPGHAHIVAVASLASVGPFPRAQAYGASKAAVRYFFDSLRVDLASEKIAVTVVQPGFVETPLTAANDFPMPFMLSADKAAKIIIRRLESKPLLVRFPRRLAWILSVMALLPGVWHAVITRQSRSHAAANNKNASTKNNEAIHRP